MDDRELELRKLDLAEEELEFKNKELKFKLIQETHRSTLKSPLAITIIGGFIALFSGMLGNFIQSRTAASTAQLQHNATFKLEKQKQESQLILKAIDTKGNNEKSRENLQFMVKAGLISDNGKIQQLIDESKEGNIVIPSISTEPSEITENKFIIIPIYIEDLPDYPGARSIFTNAIDAWRFRIITIVAVYVDSKDDADVIVRTSNDIKELVEADIGPPGEEQLEIRFKKKEDWNEDKLYAASLRSIGHILGLGLTDQTGQVMSKDAVFDNTFPRIPQSHDLLLFNLNSLRNLLKERHSKRHKIESSINQQTLDLLRRRAKSD